MAKVTQTELYVHLCDRVRDAKLLSYPFCYMSTKNILPASLYADLTNQLPPPELYHKLSDTRSQFVFTPENQAKLSKEIVSTWMDLMKVLNEIGFKQTVFNKLAKGLEQRFDTKDVNAIDCDMDIRLMRDTAGYFITPHCDTMKKIVTMQIYLPTSERNSDYGTIIYKADQGDHGKFVEVVRFPFVPNYSYAFVVNNKVPYQSWHGVETLPPSFIGARNSLLIMFNVVGGK